MISDALEAERERKLRKGSCGLASFVFSVAADSACGAKLAENLHYLDQAR